MMPVRAQIDRLLVRLPPLSAAARFVLGAAIAVMIGLLLAKVPPTLFEAGVFCVVIAAIVAALIRLRLSGNGSGDVADAPAVAPAQPDPALSIETLAVPLLQFNTSGALVRTNALARGLLDLGPADLPEPAQVFVDLGRPVRDWIVDVAAGRLPGGSEMVGLRADIRPEEGERFLQVTLQPDGQGGALAILQDTTALKRLEAQFVQGQKMQAIGQLAGGIAHDFNNLLTAISGHCDLLLLRHRPDDPEHPDLIQIRQNANRAAALVSQLLAFSRKQTLKPERIELQDTLSDLTHLLNRLVGEKVGLDLIHARETAAIRADRRQLEQVIMNLVVNARDAMPAGGVVQIETRIVSLDQELHRDRAVVPRGRHVVISVRDSGTGIPPEWMDKIFEPFFTTKRLGEGTGLGLSTVYGIVKQSGGFIFVRSVLDEGTEFELWFPLCAEAVTERSVVPPRRAARRSDGVVLLVEDEAPVRTFAARALRLRGHSVLEAASAEEALALLQDAALHVDVFVTDVVMPGLDGPGWVRQALERRPSVRTVFISGYAEDALTDVQARIPNSVFLPKPFSLAELTDTVQAQLAA
jgi:two-component system, cell cycle sensor histidine kinase and response regulator CckA